MPTMDSYPAQTTPNNSDYHIVNDGVSGATKKITRDDYLSGAPLPAGTTVPDGTIGNSSLATGVPVQIVEENFSVYATGTTTIPIDNTIPQITEGTEFMTMSFTPKSATNKLSIDVFGYFAISVAENMTIALFKDATANALAVNGAYQGTGTATTPLYVVHSMTAGTTSAITFRVRVGAGGAATTYFNGSGGQRFGGAITMSRIKVTEYKA